MRKIQAVVVLNFQVSLCFIFVASFVAHFVLVQLVFSRVKNFKDFKVTPFTLERFLKIKESKNLKPRIDEENRKIKIEATVNLSF